MAAHAHLLDQLGEHAVLLLRPLLALQGGVVLLELLQALEGAAAGLPEPEQGRHGSAPCGRVSLPGTAGKKHLAGHALP